MIPDVVHPPGPKLQDLADHVATCTACKLATTRTNTVFGEGDPGAQIMFVGEGPGRDEDLQGRPFVGRSGALLTRIIERGMKLNRSDVYIANVVKCRATVNMELRKDRPPEPEEVTACCGYLEEQIRRIAPEVIITLGNPSTRFLLQTRTGITKLRGSWHDYNGIAVMPTYHPSYVLRNGGDNSPLKKDVWHDIKLVLARLGLR